MILPLQKFSALLESMAASVQGGAAQLVDLSVGSVLRAMLEASAAVALWMQWLILQVLSVTRAATSTGQDLDSWMTDFGLMRLPGAASVGLVTFARYTPGVAATILLNTIVRTGDGTQSFSVIADPTNAAWNGTTGYSVAPALASITVPVQATLAGSAGNVSSDVIVVLTTATPGIDTVTNQSAFSGGVDPESDTALRARFPLYINSRSKATLGAVDFAVATVQQGLRYAVLENTGVGNVPLPGNFWVVTDDGSGSPPSSLLASVSAAVDVIRPIGSTFAVTGPGILRANIAMSVVTSNPLTKPMVVLAIQTAIANWVAGLPIGGTLAVSKLEALAHGADLSVISVVGSVNGGSSDLEASVSQVILLNSISVT
jgi:uncharacterized phage protein gp47/JayE